jgi:murein L,D-transpeptidase YafK
LEQAGMKMRLFLFAVLFTLPILAHADTSNVLVVDKKTNTMQLIQLTDEGPKVIKTYRATLGLVAGDKEFEGDKKTPEGIYFFEEFRRPPTIEPKFGALALTLNFPNPYDRLIKHTGSGIWLHSTDDPTRLSRAFDSLGCVVISNNEITELAKTINYKTTPIAIYDDYEKSAPFQSAEHLASLKAFVNNWAKAWSSKDIEAYIADYHPDFSNDGKSLKQWRDHKSQLNRAYDRIEVGISHLTVLSHPKYDIAIFQQNYASKLKNGKIAKSTNGIKFLYLVKDKSGPKILAEEFRHGSF